MKIRNHHTVGTVPKSVNDVMKWKLEITTLSEQFQNPLMM